jgi:hypothetical protein
MGAGEARPGEGEPQRVQRTADDPSGVKVASPLQERNDS